MISILKCFKHSRIKINQNNKKLLTNFQFLGVVTSYDLKNNVLFIKLKEWYTQLSSSNEAICLKDVLTKQHYLQQVQDERREVGKHIIDVRKLFIEKQDKLFLINRWENLQQYVNLRKEEAELIIKEHELTARFEELDKTEKELFAVLNNTVKDSYEREKAKKLYMKYWGLIITIVIVMLSGLFTKISTNEENEFCAVQNFEIQMKEPVILGTIGVVLLFIICTCCR